MNKPKIICHIMSSVDGRLIPSRWTPPFDGTPAGELFAEYARLSRELNTDAWMFGLGTAQEGPLPERFIAKTHEHELPREPFVAARPNDGRRMFIVSDPEGQIFYNTQTVRGDRIITIIGKGVSDEYLSHLQDRGISYVFGGETGYDLTVAMAEIADNFGVRSISLQGGGIIDGQMLADGLLDELSLVIYPGIDGLHGSPSIFEYIGGKTDRPAAGQSLELISATQCAHGVMHLRYKFHR